MSKINLYESTESDLAYLQFDTVLRNVYSHPFVTEKSREWRRYLHDLVLPSNEVKYEPNNYIDPFTEDWVNDDPYFPVPFVFGSVARGQATQDSDVDYIIIHETETFSDEHPRCEQMGSRYLKYLGDTGESVLRFIDRLIDSTVPPEVIFFCPAVGEFLDDEYHPEIARATYILRKQCIEAINKMGQNGDINPEAVWDRIRNQLDLLLLPNLTARKIINTIDPLGYIAKDREQRLLKHRSGARSNNDHNRVDRFFESFDNLRFPDWQTMKLAFRVE